MTTLQIKADTSEAERALGRLNNSITSLASAFGAVGIVNFVDSITTMNNKLRQVTNSQAEFNAVQKQLFSIANATGASIEDTTTLYQKMTLAADAAGLTTAGVGKITELVSKQMATVGMTTAETSSFLLQFGQAMASGRLQGDEFRSMMETNVPLAKLLAEQLGVTVGELKNMASEGKITSKVMADAIFAAQEKINGAGGAMQMTISKAFTVLVNNAKQAFAEMESGSGIVQGITQLILLLAENLKTAIQLALAFVTALAVQKLVSIARGVDGISGAFGKLNATIRANAFVALATAIIFVGEKIYSEIIKPLKDAGIASGVIGRYIAQNLLNAFFQVSEYLLSWAPATGKLILDALTPGKSITESWNEVMAIQNKILTKERFKFVSDEELKNIDKVLAGTKKTTEAVQQQGDLRKEAAEAASQQQKDALKALDAYINGLKRAAAQEQDRVLYGQRQAEINQAIQEQQDKLAVVGLKLSQQQIAAITNNLKLKQSYADIATTQQTLKQIGDEINLNSIFDTRERDKQSKLLQYQSQVSKEIYEANKSNLEALITQSQLTQDLNTYKTTMRDLDNEIANLRIRDTREREVQNQLTQYQLQVGQKVFEITGKQVELKIRERLAQQLLNDEVLKGRDLVLGTFGDQIRAIKNTETAIEELIKQEDKRLKSGTLTIEELIQSEKDLALLQDSLHIQELKRMKDQATLSRNYVNESVQQQMIEIRQIEALYREGLINKDAYNEALLATDLEYYYKTEEALKKSLEKRIQMELMAAQGQVGGIQLTMDEQKKAAQQYSEFYMKTDYQKTQFALENAATIFNALGAQNKKAFEAAKALNIAVAIMNTYRAATIALASYPPPFNFIAMAAAIATGFAQVSAIRSQQYSGRALGGGVMGGGSYIVGERGPELFTPNVNGSITNNGDLMRGGGGTQVNFTIVANDTRGFDELLSARRGLITQIISDAQLEQGRRG